MSRLADVLIGHCCKAQPGERVYLECTDTPEEMVCALIDRIAQAGAVPFVRTTNSRVRRAMYMHASEDQMRVLLDCDRTLMREMQYCITVTGADNAMEMSDLPDERLKIILEHWTNPATEFRLSHAKWIALHWPTPGMAQLARMSTAAFEDFYFDVCTLDYSRMTQAAAPLRERMMASDIVRIRGWRDTDITFSIKDMPAVMCTGERNLPDGELFTAPVKDSINGVIRFNAGSIYHGKPFDDICLRLRNGRVVRATSSDTEALNDILDTDEGARYIGEFSLGFNPRIDRVMRDVLFDEKITGSMHFTPGQAYDEADNGNRSSIHWDMVMVQTPEFGGGSIYFDDELIRHDGRFVPDYLQRLNPENLI